MTVFIVVWVFILPMDTCNKCSKKNVCNKICPDIEVVLNGTGHSIKSVYRVLFFAPNDLEKYFSALKRNEIIETKRVYHFKRLLRRCFKRLTKRQKKCLILYYGMKGYQPLTQIQIANRLKIDQSMVCVHLRNGKKKLRKLVEKQQNI